MPAVLTSRRLNRLLMARQGLLVRSPTSAAAMLEQLVGMQAQVPTNPYLALWSRLEGFEPDELSALVAARGAVRAPLMRATLHLVTARDCLALSPLAQPVLARTFKSQFTRAVAGADVGEIVAAGSELLAQAPRTRAELSALLAPRFPSVEPSVLGLAVTYGLMLVQVPPRGLWRRSGQARWALTEDFLGAELAGEATVDGLVLRYLAAFGPATVSDIRTWSSFTGLRAVVDRLRPGLRTFSDEQGRELLDVPHGALPDPGTPAPPRFLPEYDNVMLSHADRSRVLGGHGPGLPFPTGRTIGTLLVDGFYRANWAHTEAGGVATLAVDRFVSRPEDPAGTVEAIEDEAAGLLTFLAPEAAERRVTFLSEPGGPTGP